MKRKKPQPAPERTILEQAAIAACKRLNKTGCPCERAPGVCVDMKSAIISAVRAVATANGIDPFTALEQTLGLRE